ncbi:MAG: YlxR family protein [Deltaproteobacteria bacterium]|nr:YlxR family protein [Deltaproteobacteria bacterium]MCB9479069.1 YlxR family protein [Deltaproteobacteria bacterium]MCB9488131.1 YlxR family protein [Deltaproteobacteria bacterium]
MSRRGHRPTRSCCACRRRFAWDALLRFTAGDDGRVVADPERRRPGRGAYLCPDAACVDKAIKKGALARGLRRRQLLVDEHEVRAAMERFQNGRTPESGEGFHGEDFGS